MRLTPRSIVLTGQVGHVHPQCYDLFLLIATMVIEATKGLARSRSA